MIDKAEQELNIKLAVHFLGIKKIYYGDWDEDKTSPMFIPSGKPWKTHSIDAIPVPNFTGSLDACFKGLVPKLGETLIGIDFIPPHHRQKEWLCNVEFDEVPLESYKAKAGIPALALCLAIEKLIDHDVNRTTTL